MNTQTEYAQLKQQNRRRLIGAIVIVLIAAIVLISVLNNEPAKHSETAVVQVEGQTAPNTTQSQVLPNPLNEPSHTPPVAETTTATTAPATQADSTDTTDTTLPESTPPQTQAQPSETPKHQLSPREILDGKAGKKIFQEQSPKTASKAKQNNSKQESKAKPSTKPESKRNPQDILNGKTTASGSLIIQVGAFSDPIQAQAVRQKLQDMGIRANIYSAYTSKGQVARVRVTNIANRPQAEGLLKKIQQAGLDGIIISQ